MEFKKLEIKEEGNWLQQKLKDKHIRKTAISIFLGACSGFLFYYLSDGMHIDAMPRKDIVQSVVIGAFLGFWLTNSPCARGKC